MQSLAALETEMRSVARGEMVAPKGAAESSFESVEALTRLLTADNRLLLAIIRDRKPRSAAELAGLVGAQRAELSRRLETMRAAGLVRFEDDTADGVPNAVVARIVVDIDLDTANDQVHAELAE
jgi:predicted transcriptional regulator